jgi:antitoxin VapB
MSVLHKARAFKSGNSLAVRLPKDIAFAEGTELEAKREGDAVILRPVRVSVRDMIAALNALPRPGEIEERDVDVFPERPGL